MTLVWALVGMLLFPGLVYGVPMSWLMVWIERKATARMQGRIGPPFYQPFWDFVKLMAKRPVPRQPIDALMMTGLPVLAIGSLLGALAIMPVFLTGGFVGDMVLLAGLLEIPPLCAVMAGYASSSIFGQVGSNREAVLSIAYNLPLLAALVAVAAAAGSLQFSSIVLSTPAVVRVLAVVVLILCLPVKLRVNPFSVANAEQEIYAGTTTEYDGSKLALWELAHGLEWVALTGLIAVLILPFRTGNIIADGILFIVVSLMLVVLVTSVSAATARVKLAQAADFYLKWGVGLSLALLVIVVVVPRVWGI